ncbi:DUF6950 family protein [Ancylobacter mangrovi]|uniref:DUF6950 family protein n=1 Tax=Ancylobacter mangrovi TaxID=2972472 RepID=UPI002161612C|nr:hypothetical protein [Ancylobacter mangrovi]MCS0501627.1 hypothetical protein [Ancylobacter mangrovi]
MTADLPAFLRRMASEPFAWGRFDCALTVADWWLANHGHDPAARLRGTYATREECRAVLVREGGLLRLVGRLAAATGASRLYEARPGAFGIVRQRDEHLAMICTPGMRWAAKSESGIVAVAHPHLVAMWSV